MVYCNERQCACLNEKIPDDCNGQCSGDNDGDTGATENIYSSVDDVCVLACGSNNAYNYMDSEMYPAQTLSPSCGQSSKPHDTIPESDRGVLHGSKQN